MRLFPNIDLGVHHIGIQVVEVLTGSLSSRKRVVYKEMLSQSEQFFEAKREEKAFRLKLPMDTFTYKGKNAEVFYQIETIVDFDGKTDKIIRKDAAKGLRLLNVFNPEKGTTKKIPLKIMPTHEQYKIVHCAKQYSYKSSINYLIAGLAGLSSGLALGFGLHVMFGIIGGITAGVVAFQISKSYLQDKFKGLHFDIRSLEDGRFEVLLESEKPEYFKDTEIIYTVMEKVVDDRGTSTSTYYDKYYESPAIPVSLGVYNKTYELEVPTKSCPPSKVIGDLTIYWELKLMAGRGNFIHTFSKIFTVHLVDGKV